MRNDTILPLGAECDSCNQYASKLEQALIHHPRIYVPIMRLRVPGKKGKKRKSLGHYTADDRKQLLKVHFSKSQVHFFENTATIVFPTPSQFDEFNFRRCLGHIGLNYTAWKFGWETALEPRFDPIRVYVRKGHRSMTWPYGQVSHSDEVFRNKLRLEWQQDAPGLTIMLQSYVDDFFIDILNTGGLENWLKTRSGIEVLYFK